MKLLPIKATDRPLLSGDLNACVTSEALEVPRKVAEAVDGQDIRTARQLIAYGEAFPTAMALAFGWSNDQVASAIARLSVQLGGDTPKRRMVTFGARDPRELENR
jgi:hypothetical protein